MRVVLASENKPKQLATQKAFSKVFNKSIAIETCPAKSNVSSHPTHAEESLEGAINRMNHASRLMPGADYYVGIEGGLLRLGDKTWEHSWVCIKNSKGMVYTAISAGMEIKGKILKSILSGQTLNETLEDQFDVVNAGAKNGFTGMLTDNLITREKAAIDAIILAISPFLHPEFYK